MDKYESLNHTAWDCKYHVVFIPKCGEGRCISNCASTLERCFASWQRRRSAGWRKEFDARYVHMMLSIPPKYAVSQVVGFIKGKSAIHLARVYGERKRTS